MNPSYMPELLKLTEDGTLMPEMIISHRMKPADAALGYEVLNKKQDSCLKVMSRREPLFGFGPAAARACQGLYRKNHERLTISQRLRAQHADTGAGLGD